MCVNNVSVFFCVKLGNASRVSIAVMLWFNICVIDFVLPIQTVKIVSDIKHDAETTSC